MFYTISGKKIIKAIFIILIIVAVLAAGWTAFNTFYPLNHRDLILKYADEYDLSPALVTAVIRAESRFNETAISRKGAKGLMQIMDTTGEWLAGEIGLIGFKTEHVFDPETNILLGCHYLRRLLNQFDDEMTVALAAYNAGSGTVRGWLNDPKYSNDGKTLFYIPFPETRRYVERIDEYLKVYELYFKILPN